jgi:hypothetical protein
VSGSTLILSGGTIGSGATVAATSGSTAVISGLVTATGTVNLSGVTSVAAHATLEMLSGGTAILGSGTVTNSGTVFASGIRSLLQIDSGAVVNGGLVEVGNGIVDVLSGGSANVAFLSTGSGGLEIADTSTNSHAFTGAVSSFGGVNHTNHKQFIDLVSVTFNAGQIASAYTSAAGSGTLTVSSGGQLVASIEFVGNYSAGNFHITSGHGGIVEITDPTVPNGGSIDARTADASALHSGIDLPNIAFGAQTTLAYTEGNAETGGTLTVTDGRHAAAITLLGNYMAGSFAAAADGHGGTLLTRAPQTEQPLLTHPSP